MVSSLYLLPAALGMGLLGTMAGRIAHRFGSKPALLVGTAITAVSFAWLAVAHRHPYDMLISAALLGIGIGLAFAALGNLIVQAVPPSQTGVATGMNTVMRTLGGALGGQLSATFIADNTAHGLPDRDRVRRLVRDGRGVPRRVRTGRAAHPRAARRVRPPRAGRPAGDKSRTGVGRV